MPVPRISKEALKERLESTDPAAAPLIIDVRLKYPWEHSTVKLPGAVRVSPQDPDFSALPAGREIVAYDSDPDELVSAPVVALLIDRGYRATALKGGIADWMAASLPTEPRVGPAAPAPAEPAAKG